MKEVIPELLPSKDDITSEVHRSEEQILGKVFLLSSSARRFPFILSMAEGKVLPCLYLRSKDMTFTHELSKTHFMCVAEDSKRGDLPNLHQFVGLGSPEGVRKLIFLQFDTMVKTVEKLVKAQGFRDRIDQYELKYESKQLPTKPGKKYYRVKHKMTGEKLEIISINKKQHPNTIEVLRQEIKVMQRIGTKKLVKNHLIDLIENNDHILCVTVKRSRHNLEDIIGKSVVQGSFAVKIIRSVA